LVNSISIANIECRIKIIKVQLRSYTTKSLTSSEKRVYQYGSRTSHTPSDEPSLRTKLNGHVRGPTALSPTPICAYYANVVYQITCNNCNQHYIGSTTRFVHDRVREHLNNDSSSVKKHISKCQNKVHKGIEIKTIALEKDPANLRLFEAFYLRKYKPALNSREECSEFADLLF